MSNNLKESPLADADRTPLDFQLMEKAIKYYFQKFEKKQLKE